MHIDSARGHDFGRRSFVPEQELSVANYARVIGSTSAELRSTAAAERAGHPSRLVPAALLALYPGVPEEEIITTLGVTYGRTLVVGFTVHSHDPLVFETDELELHTRVEDAYTKSGGDGGEFEFLLLERVIRRRGEDEPVCRAVMTMFEPRGPRPPSRPRPGAESADVPGTALYRRIGPLSRLDFARFSVATDDPNRVHLEEPVAAAAGLDGVIGSGGIALALVAEHLADTHGRAAVESLRLRLSAPIEAGARLLSRVPPPGSEGPLEVVVLDEARGHTRIATGVATPTASGGSGR